MKDFLTKYHSYIIGVIAGLTVAVQVVFQITIPDWVYQLLAAAGLGSLRVTVTQSANVVMGWKTYVAAAGLAVTAGLSAMGIQVPVDVVAAIGALGGVSLAAGVRKSA